jgi:hypothetical protein
VLLIACANVASLLLGRAAVRAQETSLRVALGAGFGDLARELAADSIAISVAGGVCGIVASLWISHVLPALLYEGDAAKLAAGPPDPLAVAGRVGACAAVTIVCGLLPLFFTPHDRPALVLRRESAGPSRATRRLRTILVAVQMAGCCVLVVGTAWLFDDFRAAVRTTAGRRVGAPMVATVRASAFEGIARYRSMERATRALTGVREVAWTGRLPGALPAWRRYRVEPPQLPTREFTGDIAWLTSRVLERLDLKPRAGRLFGFADQGCRTAVVNEAAAAHLFGGATVGRTLQDGGGPPIEIVGVARSRTPQTRPMVYYDHTAEPGSPPDPTPAARFRVAADSELQEAELDAHVVSANYFERMGVPVTGGWSGDGACRVGLVNRAAADLYFGGNAIGSALIDARGQRTIIGGMVDPPRLGVFQRPVEPALYLPMSQDFLPAMTLIAWGSGESVTRIAALRSVTGAPVQPLEEYLAQTALAPMRIAMLLVGASAALGLGLCGIGLFGALSDAGRQRRRELALRIALGAQRWRVMEQVLREGGRLAVAGSTLGTVVAALLMRRLGGASAFWVWLAAPAALFLSVFLASVLPARRASIVNPVAALREEN